MRTTEEIQRDLDKIRKCLKEKCFQRDCRTCEYLTEYKRVEYYENELRLAYIKDIPTETLAKIHDVPCKVCGQAQLCKNYCEELKNYVGGLNNGNCK